MLSDVQRRLHARQILLPELGFAGQEQLNVSRVSWDPEFDSHSRDVAADYLSRAGLHCEPLPPSAAGQAASQAEQVSPPLVRRADVERWAGAAELADCTAWLLGALSAVETIKQVIGVGEPRSLAELQASWQEQR